VGTFFGTDGVRGVANTDLAPELAFKLGRASAYYMSTKSERPRVLIGKDTRLSGDMLEAAFLAGSCSVGAEVMRVGIVPTPCTAFLTRALGAHLGVMISASHNPIEDNGIKLFSGLGCKLPDNEEEKIEELLIAEDDMLPRPTGVDIGISSIVDDAEDRYAARIKGTVGADLSGLKIVLDCAYGAAFRLAPRIFRELGARVIAIHNEARGEKINVQCGSTNTATLKKAVLAENADFGVAFDGDADRCLAIDELGRYVDGDQLLTIFSKYLHDRGLLKEQTLVATVMSNLGLEKAMKKLGITLVRTKVGDRYVLEEMKKRGAVLGGEQSGHIILIEYNTTGDGIATAVLLSRIVKESGKPLSAHAAMMMHMPQLLVNVKARNKERLSDDEDVSNAIKDVEEILKDRGRLLVRPSGTEPLIRVMAEGPDEHELHDVVGRIARMIEEKLG